MALEKTLPILLIFFIGLGLKRMKILRADHAPLISQLILHVVLPATIINSLSTTDLSPRLLLLPASATLVVVTLLGIAFLLAPILGLRGKTRGAFLMAFPTLELGSIGYAFMLAVYGVGGLTLIALFDLGNALFFFTIVSFLASVFGQPTERFRVSDALMKFAKNPVLWAYGVGVAFNLLHVHIGILSQLFATLSQALLLLIMLLMAIEFELKLAALAFPALAMYLKMAIGVAVGLLVSLLFHLTGVEQMAVILGSSVPASLMTLVYARENELDVKFLASMLSLALPTSIGFSLILMSLSH